MEYISCNLCGSSEVAPLFTVPDWQFERWEVLSHLVTCRRCGLIYQNPRPTLEEMAGHYPPEYELYALAADERRASWLLKRAYQYGMAKRRQYVTRHKRGGQLLDVGCATGVFMRSIQASGGWEVYGVEVSPHAARVARDQFQLDVRLGTLEQAAFPSSFFDAVTLWDVFEHLHDPVGSLREINRILKPEGIVVLRVPNGDGWDARMFGRYWAGLEPPRHLYVFTSKTLRALLDQAGFEPIGWSSASGAYTTFLLSLRFWLRDRGGKKFTDLAQILYHPVMRLSMAPVFYLASMGMRGPLLVVTAKKKP